MAVYRVVKTSDYVTIANYHLRDKRLKMADKGLMSVLLADEGDAVYTIAELAERGPEGKDAIYAALQRLEKAGYIRRRQCHDDAGRFGATEMLIYETPYPEKPYTENPDTAKPYTENPDTVAKTPDLELNQRLDTPYRGESVISEGKEEENIKSPHKSPRKRRDSTGGDGWKPETFAAFWSSYPRHESKQAAKRAWDKLQPDDELLRRMARGLKAQLRSELWQRGIGIPYASTWLNQRRWEDELTAAVPTAKKLEEPSDVQVWQPGVIR